MTDESAPGEIVWDESRMPEAPPPWPGGDLGFASSGVPWGAWACFAFAVVLVGSGLAQGTVELMAVALLPAAVGAALWTAAEPGVKGRVVPEGIALERPRLEIPFDQIRGLATDLLPFSAPQGSFAIRVFHSRGLLKIPGRRDIDSAAILQALRSRSGPSDPGIVNPVLEGYRERYVAAFGAERVASFRASEQLGDTPRRHGPGIGLAFALTGMAWSIFAGASGRKEGPLMGLAGMAIIVGLLTLGISRLARPRLSYLARIPDWTASSLVVTPVGLALIQGKLRGELAWEQIRDVRLRYRDDIALFDSEASLPGVVLKVAGASLVIADIYDRPIEMIHERILGYWKPERLDHPMNPFS